ncbi:MAG TPA: hypothetical protein VFD01_04330 [Candidatus Dormibacteraeota bacterium]|jgi:hypothetical protein|nr:hypothetical protein [Candidatus Dormibacteraeota bacterium]
MRIIDFIRDRARYYRCPVCNRGLEDCQVRLLQHAGDRYTVQVTCASCRVQFVVILVVQGDGLEATEEAAFEPPAATEREPIQADEVLDVHLLLRDFKGRLTDLFRQPSAGRR